jgi:hypothetical protein
VGAKIGPTRVFPDTGGTTSSAIRLGFVNKAFNLMTDATSGSRRLQSLLLFPLLAPAWLTPLCAEEPRITVGLLTCTVAGATGKDNVTCGFRALGDTTEDKYEGSVEGLTLPNVGKEVLEWAVSAPSSAKPRSGFLAQSYAKARALGQPPSWIGETNKAIILRFESHESFELGSGIQRIVLKGSGTPA